MPSYLSAAGTPLVTPVGAGFEFTGANAHCLDAVMSLLLYQHQKTSAATLPTRDALIFAMNCSNLTISGR